MNEYTEAIHPGEYIKDAIISLNMTRSEFAARCGMTDKNLSTLISGESRITFEVADKLASFFHNSIEFWLSLQNRYDICVKKAEKEEEIKENWKIVKLFDRAFIEEICSLHFDNTSKEEIITELEKQFLVSSLRNLKNKDMFVFYKTQVSKDDDDRGTILRNAWISLAIKKSNDIKCRPYDDKELKRVLPKIKKMTLLNAKEYKSVLANTLNGVGIKYMELPYLKGSGISGITRWLPNEKSFLIAISNRKTDDEEKWLTIFHELGHVINNHKRYLVINGVGEKGIEEVEADSFAKDILIDRKRYREFVSRNEFDPKSISTFAKQEGVAYSIVLNRLKKDKILPSR